jgi:hypothetical protein
MTPKQRGKLKIEAFLAVLSKQKRSYILLLLLRFTDDLPHIGVGGDLIICSESK